MFWSCKHSWGVIKTTYQEPWDQEEDVGDMDEHYTLVRQGGDQTTFLLQCKRENCGVTRTVEMDGKEYENKVITINEKK